MKKMLPNDYIDVNDIHDQATLDRIRESVKRMGYNVSEAYGQYYSSIEVGDYKSLTLDMEGDLVFSTHPQAGYHRYTPAQIFAMVDTPPNKEAIKQTIEKLEEVVLTLKELLQRSDDKPTYKAGDRFYIDDRMESYILASIDHTRMALIGSVCGNSWSEPVECRSHLISKDEMNRLAAGRTYKKIEK